MRKNGKFVKPKFIGSNETSKPNKIKASGHIHRFISCLISSALAYTVYRHDTTGLGEIGKTMQSECTDADCIAAEFVKTFGRYYSLTVDAGRHGPLDWDIVDSVCPKGWHVPTRVEWEKLYASVDGAVNQLMDWMPRFKTEKNECKISFVLAGSYTPKRLNPDDVFFDGLYWSSTQCNSEYACVVIPKEVSIIGNAFPEHIYMFSLRCIKD